MAIRLVLIIVFVLSCVFLIRKYRAMRDQKSGTKQSLRYSLAPTVEFIFRNRRLSGTAVGYIAAVCMLRIMKFKIRRLTVIESMILLGATALATHFLILHL